MTRLVAPNHRNDIRDLLAKERQSVIHRIDDIAHDALLVDFGADGVPPSCWGQDQALSESLELRLHDIESALSRLEKGSYGVCATCSSEIPKRRLDALPFATLCVECQSLVDKRSRSIVH
jgi:RNA polymerase-binding transcription factor DksA